MQQRVNNFAEDGNKDLTMFSKLIMVSANTASVVERLVLTRNKVENLSTLPYHLVKGIRIVLEMNLNLIK